MTTDGTSEKFNSILNVASIGKGPWTIMTMSI